MMRSGNSYAVALFSLACEEQSSDAVAEGLNTVAKSFRAHPEYLLLLSSPGIPLSRRIGALTDTFGGHIPPTVLSFVCILCEQGQIRSYQEITEEYLRLYRESKRACIVRVTSAVPLREEEKNALEQKLSGVSAKTVTLSCTVDPALLGGLIVEFDGKILDGSIRTRLQEIKEVMHQ